MFSNDITFIPTRPGDRNNSVSTNNNAREKLNWITTMDIKDWILKIKNTCNK